MTLALLIPMYIGISETAFAGDHCQDTRTVTAVETHAAITQGFEYIEGIDEHNMRRLVALTEIPAPPFAEQKRAKALVALIKKAGIKGAHVDSVGNVIARWRGSRRSNANTVAFVAHIDTVFSKDIPIKVRRDGNTLHAPGVGDNTRALVAMLTVIETLYKEKIRTCDDILFVGSVGEEGSGNLRGVRGLLAPERLKEEGITRFIAMDGGSLQRLVVDAVGSNRYKITFLGKGGHSYGAFGSAHPHHALARAIHRFVDDATVITSEGTKATFSVGRISGGTSINSIPFSSSFDVDMRSADAAKVQALDSALRNAVETALNVENEQKSRGEPIRVEIDSIGVRPAGIGDRQSRLVKNAAATLRSFGVEPKYWASSTDANIPISLGIPAVTISRGGVARNSHSPDESWENVDGHLAIQAALMLLVAESGLHL